MNLNIVRRCLTIFVFTGVTLAVTNPARCASGNATVGQAVTFSVSVDGSAPFSYQWCKDGGNIAGATNSSYSIGSAQTSDSGNYYVSIRNSAGSTTSDYATLTVNAASAPPATPTPTPNSPVFTMQPAGQTVTAGQAVNFGVTVSGTTPYSYQWYKDGAKITGATGSTYLITSAQTSDAGNYYVVVTNPGGSATSNNAAVVVNAAPSAPSTPAPTGPVFTLQPVDQTVTVGQAVVFAVFADSTSTVLYQWYKDGAKIAGAATSSYSISNVQTGQGGNYYAVATDSVGSTISNYAVLTVNAAPTPPVTPPASAPVFTTQPGNQTVTVGASITFIAAAAGSPTPTYQWRRSGANIAGATSASFSIASVATSDAGTYTVVATNSAGSATSSGAMLTVNAAATSSPVFTTLPASQSATVGDLVTFSASAAGSPGPTYQWKKNGTNIAGATAPTFTIASVAKADAGTYTVVASNSAGSVTSNGAVLTISSAPTPPSLRTQPVGETPMVNQSTIFTVAASGNPAPTYQWQRLPAGSTTWVNLSEGGSYRGVTGSTLTVSGATAAMSGDQFRCGITNTVGTATSDAVTLTVRTMGSSLFQFPASIAEDSSGNFYVADASSNTILEIAPSGVVTTLAGAAGLAGSQDGTGSGARFNQPSGLVVDGSGNVYVADTGNATIRKVTPFGVVTTLAGSAARGNQDGSGSTASFNSPDGMAIDAAGNLYVADAFNATIRKITAGMVSTLAGSATSRGDADGSGANARFNYPNGVSADSAGNIYVADTFNDTIRKITPAGVVTTLAGSAGISGGNDGSGINALFNQPCGVAVDGSGNVFVADTGNSTIRKVTPGGVVTTVAGIAGIAGLGDGPGSTALFNQPRSLAVDSSGNVYVADTGNAAIRKLGSGGMVVTLSLNAATSTTTTAPAQSSGANTPAPVTSTASASSGGGGGGSIELWFILMLALLGAARLMDEQRRGL